MIKKRVSINVGTGYDVHIGPALLDSCGEILKQVLRECRLAIITDSNVERLYLDKVKKSLSSSGFESVSLTFPAGESSKNISTLSAILEFLAENNFTRKDAVVALGGGVVGDICGFASSVFLRGIRYVQIPTTLLSAVDSSVGGKTAIDLEAGKNLAGAFKQPEVVICDTDTLSTLNETELSNGVAESVKYGILFDKELFDEFAKSDLKSLLDDKEKLVNMIARCVSHKGRIVEKDEFDNGERRLLNLGHTIGHAVEKCSSFSVPHGHAVAIGTSMIARAGEEKGLTECGTFDAVKTVLEKYALPTSCEFSSCELLSSSLNDKKRKGNKIGLVIIESIGKCYIKEEPIEALESYIK